jgi:uncharacterized protein
MIVVSDTTAITNLLKIGEADLLRQLFGEIIIPSAVDQELKKIKQHNHFILENKWILVEKPSNLLAVRLLRTTLGEGESEAIVLAKEKNADYLIIDELKGRAKAKEMGVKLIGLLGVLLEAKREGIISAIKPLLERLQKDASFFIHPELYTRILQIAAEQ